MPSIASIALPALVVASLRSPPLSLAQDAAIDAKVVAWRRDIHEHPELSFEETRTAQVVAAHLRQLRLEVRTGVGGHGVVGVLRGVPPPPGGVVALRADMDALPVTEESAGYSVGQVAVRAGGLMASSPACASSVRGRQTHGAIPWATA